MSRECVIPLLCFQALTVGWTYHIITLSSLSIPSSNVIATAALVTLSMPQAKGDICLLRTSDQMTNGRQRCQCTARSEALPIR